MTLFFVRTSPVLPLTLASRCISGPHGNRFCRKHASFPRYADLDSLCWLRGSVGEDSIESTAIAGSRANGHHDVDQKNVRTHARGDCKCSESADCRECLLSHMSHTVFLQRRLFYTLQQRPRASHSLRILYAISPSFFRPQAKPNRIKARCSRHQNFIARFSVASIPGHSNALTQARKPWRNSNPRTPSLFRHAREKALDQGVE